jgi:hypothetical protein
MRTAIWISLAALVVAFTGCVPSLHPLYTDKDLVFEEKLLGTWWEKGDDPDESWEFKRKEGKTYELIYRKKDKFGVYKAHLVRLEGRLFLDLFPGKELPEKGHLAVPYVPMHWILRIRLDDAGLRLDPMDISEMKKLVDKNPEAVKHERVKDGVLLTASTAELQKFVLAHVAEKDKIFAKGELLTKK